MSGNLVQALVMLVQLYSLVLLARIILSWTGPLNRSNPLILLVYQLTEPVLAPVRQILPSLGMVDLSPLVVFIGLHFLRSFLLSLAGDL